MASKKKSVEQVGAEVIGKGPEAEKPKAPEVKAPVVPKAEKAKAPIEPFNGVPGKFRKNL